MGFHGRRTIDGRFASANMKTEKPYMKIELEEDDPVCGLIEEAIEIREERDRLAAKYKKLQKCIAAIMVDERATILEHPGYWVDLADEMKVPDSELLKRRMPEGYTVWVPIDPTVVITKKK